MKAYTVDQLDRLLSAVPEVCPDTDRRLLIETLAASACRISEVLGLQHDDLDRVACELTVRRQLYQGQETTPKGRRSRVVLMPDHLVARLRQLRVEQEQRALAQGRVMTPWMFQQHNGRPFLGGPLRVRSWKRIVRRAGVPDHGFHGLRHTRISLWMEAGVNPRRIASMAGHRNMTYTMQKYGHVIPDADMLVHPAKVPYRGRSTARSREMQSGDQLAQ